MPRSRGVDQRSRETDPTTLRYPRRIAGRPALPLAARGSNVAPTVQEAPSRVAAIQAAGSEPTDAVDPRDRSDLPPNP